LTTLRRKRKGGELSPIRAGRAGKTEGNKRGVGLPLSIRSEESTSSPGNRKGRRKGKKTETDGYSVSRELRLGAQTWGTKGKKNCRWLLLVELGKKNAFASWMFCGTPPRKRRGRFPAQLAGGGEGSDGDPSSWRARMLEGRE